MCDKDKSSNVKCLFYRTKHNTTQPNPPKKFWRRLVGSHKRTADNITVTCNLIYNLSYYAGNNLDMGVFFVSSPSTYMSAYSTLGQQQWSTQPNHDVMGPVKAVAVAFGLEWLSTLIPILLVIIVFYCCVKRKRHQSSQTDVATKMTATRPEPDGQDHIQVGTVNRHRSRVTSERLYIGGGQTYLMYILYYNFNNATHSIF